MNRPARTGVLVVVALLALLVAGCSSSGGSTGGTPSTDSSGRVSIDVTFKDGKVTPNGERVKVKQGQAVTLHVTADQAGQIHVHSTPEQQLDYGVGSTTLSVKDLDQPGLVEVESHALDQTILQLQVQ